MEVVSEEVRGIFSEGTPEVRVSLDGPVQNSERNFWRFFSY